MLLIQTQFRKINLIVMPKIFPLKKKHKIAISIIKLQRILNKNKGRISKTFSIKIKSLKIFIKRINKPKNLLIKIFFKFNKFNSKTKITQ